MRWIMRSKLHNAIVTEANLAYVGSITIDEDLLDAVGLWPGGKGAGRLQHVRRPS